MELGNLILKYRKQNNLSQEDLAKEIGVTRQTISKWELNETSPDLKQAAKLAELFGVGVNDLINERNKEDGIKSKDKQITKNILFKIIKIIGITFGIIILISKVYGASRGNEFKAKANRMFLKRFFGIDTKQVRRKIIIGLMLA